MRMSIELRSMIAASLLGHILFSAWVDGASAAWRLRVRGPDKTEQWTKWPCGSIEMG